MTHHWENPNFQDTITGDYTNFNTYVIDFLTTTIQGLPLDFVAASATENLQVRLSFVSALVIKLCSQVCLPLPGPHHKQSRGDRR